MPDISSRAVRKQQDGKQRVAIIGGGIGGLSTAYHLDKDFDVTLYEAKSYLGGHTDTHSFNLDGQTVRIDSGFIIFCPEYYPHFSSMLQELGVSSKPTDMSFSAYNRISGTVYNATNPNKLFCDRKNIFRPNFWRMIFDILRFYSRAPRILDDKQHSDRTVIEFLQRGKYSAQFIDDHLLPMISALWSATPERVKEFPIHHLVDFFQRHGLLKIFGRPQWLVVENGSASYVEALQSQLRCDWRLNTPVKKITRINDRIEIETSRGKKEIFDFVVIATHPDTSLDLLSDPSEIEQQTLGQMRYERNEVIVHTDESIMHPNRRSWASWNTYVPLPEDQNSLACCTANYWMNSLQGLNLQSNVFVTLNSSQNIDDSKVLTRRNYSHPIFDVKSVAAQKNLPLLNGKKNTFYAGAGWGWGFHEDGARTGFQAAEMIKATLMAQPVSAEAA